jgi:hypothetical protein
MTLRGRVNCAVSVQVMMRLLPNIHKNGTHRLPHSQCTDMPRCSKIGPICFEYPGAYMAIFLYNEMAESPANLAIERQQTRRWTVAPAIKPTPRTSAQSMQRSKLGCSTMSTTGSPLKAPRTPPRKTEDRRGEHRQVPSAAQCRQNGRATA